MPMSLVHLWAAYYEWRSEGSPEPRADGASTVTDITAVRALIHQAGREAHQKKLRAGG